MLSFEEKKAIFDSFEELTCQPVSLNRLNYHFEESAIPKTTLVKFLHPKSGNAFIYAGYLPGQETKGGYISVHGDTKEQIIEKVNLALEFLRLTEDGFPEGYEEEWRDNHGDELTLRYQNYMWVVVMTSGAVEAVFKTKQQAEGYLMDEGFE
ncbi:hypothetical protein G7081_07240 [Vagococcus coleopterorum]|uniref:Uncharacterized protein n=1 Tax=Vagococcus coleopterorum TaxID=2714946 RepID=A0A6G8AP81_9ENTE|nr:hypothetical protein [Vagococcus coleopterorum]QIL46881.1 hypothetical protein G7081_07240 [Vagococcus coleopterorum]